MARGRFIDKGTCLDKKINSFSIESELGFILLLTHADCEGRVFGDPEVVKSLIFPRRKEITPEMMGSFIDEWTAAGMIILYDVEDDTYIQFVNFEKHQKGLRKDREPVSTIPEYSAGSIRQSSGNHPEESPVKLSKVKLSQDKGKKKPAPTEIVKQTQELLDYFVSETNLTPSKGNTLDIKWLIPLTQMLDAAGFDIDRAKELLLLTIKDCDRTNYTFSTPYQIQSRFNGIAAKQGRKKPAGTEFDPSTV